MTIIKSILMVSIFTFVRINSGYSYEQLEPTQQSPLVQNNSSLSIMDLPSYKHENVKTQINNYREIYEPYKGNQKFMHIHIKGLFNQLKIGVALARDYVIQKFAENEKLDPRIKEVLLNSIQNIYDIAQTQDADQKFNLIRFSYANLNLSAIVSLSKQEDIYRFNPKNIYESFKNSGEFNEFKKDDILIVNEKPNFVKERIFFNEANKILLVAIIYTNNPKTAISADTYVQNMIDAEFPLALALFDVNIYDRATHEGKSSKYDIHYSEYGGTYNLLYHDLLHYSTEINKTYYLNKYCRLNIYSYTPIFQNIFNLLKQEKDELSAPALVGEVLNKQRIFSNGLFIMFHELSVVFNGDGKFTEMPFPASFEDLIKGVKKKMIQSLIDSTEEIKMGISEKGRGRDYYKMLHRDHEFIVKNAFSLAAGHQPYLPPKEDYKKLTPKEKEEVFSKAYEKFWDDFLSIYLEYKDRSPIT